MLLKTMLIASAFVVGASGALASTVTVDFSSTRYKGVTPDTNTGSGTFSQNGFDVDWNYVGDALGLAGSSFTRRGSDIGFLSDCGPFGGCGEYGTDLTLSKSGGGTFSLSGVDTRTAYEAFSMDVSFTPFESDGVTLDTSATTGGFLPILRDSLKFTGTKSDGSTVSVSARTGTAANAPDMVSNTNIFGAGPAQFSPGDLAQLSDLTSLNIAIDTGSTLDQGALTSLQEFGLPLELQQAVQQCGFTSCTIAGVGQLDFGVFMTGGRNDTLGVGISGITLTSPAAVPLPATAVLLLAGLGLLGAARTRRRG